MKCNIDLSWQNGDEEVNLSRTKSPDEVWASPDRSWRSVAQAIDVLDATYADVRAALIAVLPSEVRKNTSLVVKMTPEQARNFTGVAE